MTVLTVVAKIGSSSLTDEAGAIKVDVIAQVASQVARLREAGHRVVVVSSGAVASGLGPLGLSRPTDVLTLQAISAVGQSRLMRVWDDSFERHGFVSGQVLLVPHDFFERTQYLHARATLGRLLDLGVIPVVNENDALADDEIRFGDNDRISALVAHLLNADVLVLLTDTPGLFTSDPRSDPSAELIAEIAEITAEIEALAGGTGSRRGSGGMSSKVKAAKLASWSGVRVVIASARRPNALLDAVDDKPGVGTVVRPSERRLSARKLWIAFAVETAGQLRVDSGARQRLSQTSASLLPAGVVEVLGEFGEGAAVDIADQGGHVFARGLSRMDSATARLVAGRRSDQLPEDVPRVVVHRDDLVVLP